MDYKCSAVWNFTEFPGKDSLRLLDCIWCFFRKVEQFQKLCSFARWQNIRAWRYYTIGMCLTLNPQCNSLSLLGVTLKSNCKFSEHVTQKLVKANSILGDPGAISRDDAIFSGDSYFKSWRVPGNLFLPNQFQKWASSVPPIEQKNIFLPNQRWGLAR